MRCIHLQSLGLEDIVQFHVHEAVQTLQQTAGPFDLSFNDIDKHAYPDSLPVIRQITTDTGWIASLVPLRDGLIVAYKR